MKKKDIMLGGGICIIAVLIWLLSRFVIPGSGNEICITADGEIYGKYSLLEDQVIEIGDTNICEIKDGKVKMIQADCPDQLCVHQKAADAQGGSIVCLPNKVVIEVIKGESAQHSGVDAVI